MVQLISFLFFTSCCSSEATLANNPAETSAMMQTLQRRSLEVDADNLGPYVDEQGFAIAGGHAATQPQVPRILHRVMLPRGDGLLECQGHSGGFNITEEMIRFRTKWYDNNEGWEEYIWGEEAIAALFKKSEGLFRENGLTDFVNIFTNMKQWMYQQDTIRHLILYHFGGLYMDIDILCKVDVMEEIIGDNALVLRNHGKTNFMAAKPHHKFFLKMLKRINDGFAAQTDDEEVSAVDISGEHQIARTLSQDYGVTPYKGGVHELESGKLKLTGEKDVENWCGDCKCTHHSLSSWTQVAVQKVAQQSLSEAELAKRCPVVYDERTTWGPTLINKALGLQLLSIDLL